MTIESADITGWVLAGGRGTRMGNADKGLHNFRGMPLALHAILRLAPQVGRTMIGANRNLAAYEAMGVPVWPDTEPGYRGPLAGWLSGLEHCTTRYLAVVPCDAPWLPTDLVARLAGALAAADAEIALAATRKEGSICTHEQFCLLDSMLLESLARFLRASGEDFDDWSRQHRCTHAVFDDPQAFRDANTLDELRQLEARSA